MGATRDARACEHCASRIPASDIDESPWPRFGPQIIVSSGVGLCWRQDENVKDGGGPCGDFALGLDVPFARRMRVTSELIAVFTEHIVAGSHGAPTAIEDRDGSGATVEDAPDAPQPAITSA